MQHPSKTFNSLIISLLMAISSGSTFALNPADDLGQTNSSNGSAADKIAVLLTNWGLNFGYDLSHDKCPPGNPDCIEPTGNSALLDFNQMGTLWGNALNSYLSALMLTPIIPTDNSSKTTNSNAQDINKIAGSLFNNYASESTSTASVFSAVDQTPYQANPVNQAVLNILATPDTTYCNYYTTAAALQSSKNPAAQLQNTCPLLFNAKVASAAVSSFPPTKYAFTGEYNQPVVTQLSSEVLLGPLQYATSQPATSGNSNNNTAETSAIPTATQLDQAQAYVRYITGQFGPLQLPRQSMYDQLVSQAKNLTQNVSAQDQVAAIGKLLSYFIKLRVYAAQTSVAIGNIYQIFASRLAGENQEGGNNASQALNEYVMATWRLSNQAPKGQTDPWLTQINKASSATVNKEVATLLAEMNYQLYLNRVMQERILLTLSVSQLQNAQTTQPDADFGSASASGNSQTNE